MVIATVNIEVIMADQEREKLEDMILRLRGVMHQDLEAVRRGAIRLKEARCAPRTELPPMKNLRPEGARAEEGQEARTREEEKRSTEKEEGGDQERRQEVRGQAASNQPAREQA